MLLLKGAAKAMSLVLPSLKGKLDGTAKEFQHQMSL